MITQQFEVKGMTCNHCVQAVTEELQALAGVREVAVDLATGGVAVTSEEALPAETVSAAVAEAGYELVR